MAVLTMVDGVEQAFQRGWTIRATANGRDSLACSIVSRDASVRPAIDEEILVLETLGTSETSLTIGTGSKVFTTQAALYIVVGQRVRAYRTTAVTSWMEGFVTDYTGTALTVTVDVTNGAGTIANWTIAEHIFGGQIQTATESGLNGQVSLTPITTDISALDFNGYLERIYVNGVLFAGSLKSMLITLVDLLDNAGFGVTLDPLQVDGPDMPDMTLPFVKVSDVMTDLANLSGYLYEIDYSKVLRMYAAGSRTCPFDIAAGDKNAIGDVTVERTRVPDGAAPYANRVFVVWGGTPATIRRFDIVSNTAANPTVITTSEPHQLFTSAIVTISDNVGSSADINGAGHVVTLITPTTFSIPVNCLASGGTGGSFVRTDDLSSPIYAMAEDAGEQAAHGLWENVVTVTGVTMAATAQTIADASLVKFKVRPAVVSYATFQRGAKPGQTQTITLPRRDVSGSHILTDVITQGEGSNSRLQRDISAMAGSVLTGTFRDTYKLWGGERTSSALVTGAPSTGGTASVYELGGSGLELQQTTSGAWVAASAMRKGIDAVSRGTVYATVTVRLQASSGSVTARLRDITNGTTAGTSAAITSTSWQDTTFGVTLTWGFATYELQLSPSVSDADIAGVGYLE